MRNKITRVFLVIFLLSGTISCSMFESSQIYLNNSNQNYQIIFTYDWTQNASVYLKKNNHSYFLFDYLPKDAEESIVRCSTSTNGIYFAFLIGTSTRYEHGTNLLLFSIEDLPDGDELTPLHEDQDSEVTDFTILDTEIRYQISGETELTIFPFPL